MLKTIYEIEAVAPDGTERGEIVLTQEAIDGLRRLIAARPHGGGLYRLTFEWLSEEDLTKENYT